MNTLSEDATLEAHLEKARVCAGGGVGVLVPYGIWKSILNYDVWNNNSLFSMDKSKPLS